MKQWVFLAVLILGLPWQLEAAAVTFRAATTVTNGTGNPFTHAVTVDATDNVIVVPIFISGATSRTGGAPTIGGQALTQAGTEQQAAASPEMIVELWYFIAPPSGSQTVSIPNSGALSLRTAVIGGTSSTGIAIVDTSDGGNGTSLSPADTITTGADGAMIVAVLVSGANTWNPTAWAGTSLFDTDLGNFGISAQYLNQTSAGAQSMFWTFTNTSEDWAICSVSIKTVAAGGGTSKGGAAIGVYP